MNIDATAIDVGPRSTPTAEVRRDTTALRKAWRTYRGIGVSDRAFVAARYAIAPLGRLAPHFSQLDGNVLSLGVGLCMVERYLAEMNPALTFTGIDIDPAKLAAIEQTHDRSPRVNIVAGDVTNLENFSAFDAVMASDVLHHVPQDLHGQMIAGIRAALVPGGICIVKDLDREPAWKMRWNGLHDRLVAGPDPLWCRTPADLATQFEQAGMTIETAERIDYRFEPYAHYVLVARKPT